MDALISFFTGIGEVIVTVIDFVIGLFEDLIYVIQLTGKFLGQIPSFFSWLPAELLTILVTIFAIVVIYKVMGREG